MPGLDERFIYLSSLSPHTHTLGQTGVYTVHACVNSYTHSRLSSARTSLPGFLRFSSTCKECSAYVCRHTGKSEAVFIRFWRQFLHFGSSSARISLHCARSRSVRLDQSISIETHRSTTTAATHSWSCFVCGKKRRKSNLSTIISPLWSITWRNSIDQSYSCSIAVSNRGFIITDRYNRSGHFRFCG